MRGVRFELLALVLPVMLLLAASATAQEQHLGEVGGTVALDKPGGEPVVIDNATLPPKPPEVQQKSYPERLAELVESYRTAVKGLESALAEMKGTMSLYEPAWR